VLAGDFNVGDPGLDGYTCPLEGIDHVLTRGADGMRVVVWPRERRKQNGIVLSDHPIVEAELEVVEP
jgi:endonuclease/exonuclease/phosphatase family metal-dependent hydrolase